MAKLQIHPAGGDPFEVEIGNTATIGRLRDSTVCLSFSPQTSRQHAIIRCHNAYEYQLIDLGSRNGTSVNGQRVIMPVTLSHGARIQIADTEMVFEQAEEPIDDQSMEATLGGSLCTVSTQDVALMVCDIRGFSTMAEQIPPGDLAQILGVWFRETGNLIQKSGGTIDKFIGDAVLAYWSSPEGTSVECDTALETGRKLLAMAATMKWPGPANSKPFNIAVALHFGKVSCSNIGIVAQRDATIIGDAVNTVFRLEQSMKSLGKELVLSAALAQGLSQPPPLTDLGEQTLKGKQHAVQIFSLA